MQSAVDADHHPHAGAWGGIKYRHPARPRGDEERGRGDARIKRGMPIKTTGNDNKKRG